MDILKVVRDVHYQGVLNSSERFPEEVPYGEMDSVIVSEEILSLDFLPESVEYCKIFTSKEGYPTKRLILYSQIITVNEDSKPEWKDTSIPF